MLISIYQVHIYIYAIYVIYIYTCNCFVRRSVLPIPPTNRTTKNTLRVRLISLTCFDRFQDLKMVVSAGCFHIIPCKNALFTNVIPLRKQLVYAYGFFQTVHRDVFFFLGVTSSSSSVGFQVPAFLTTSLIWSSVALLAVKHTPQIQPPFSKTTTFPPLKLGPKPNKESRLIISLLPASPRPLVPFPVPKPSWRLGWIARVIKRHCLWIPGRFHQSLVPPVEGRGV